MFENYCPTWEQCSPLAVLFFNQVNAKALGLYYQFQKNLRKQKTEYALIFIKGSSSHWWNGFHGIKNKGQDLGRLKLISENLIYDKSSPLGSPGDTQSTVPAIFLVFFSFLQGCVVEEVFGISWGHLTEAQNSQSQKL